MAHTYRTGKRHLVAALAPAPSRGACHAIACRCGSARLRVCHRLGVLAAGIFRHLPCVRRRHALSTPMIQVHPPCARSPFVDPFAFPHRHQAALGSHLATRRWHQLMPHACNCLRVDTNAPARPWGPPCHRAGSTRAVITCCPLCPDFRALLPLCACATVPGAAPRAPPPRRPGRGGINLSIRPRAASIDDGIHRGVLDACLRCGPAACARPATRRRAAHRRAGPPARSGPAAPINGFRSPAAPQPLPLALAPVASLPTRCRRRAFRRGTGRGPRAPQLCNSGYTGHSADDGRQACAASRGGHVCRVAKTEITQQIAVLQQ